MKVVPTSAMSTDHATADGVLPSDELATLLPPGWLSEFPLARVRTCGILAVEVLIDLHPGPDGRRQPIYGPPAASLFAMKGMTTALVLLALLASQPGGFASKDFLMQTLAHLRRRSLLDEENEWEDVEPLTRLDNVVSLLRKLLYPPMLLTFSGAKRLRKHLIRFVRATQESGPGYRLAGFPLLWLDVEALEMYIARARRLEARGEDRLEDWQAAYQIGMRGPFLDHEPYSEWADWRRGRVTDLLWQSVDAQWKRAASWEEGMSGREAALHLLLAFWQTHMTNEDAFRSLVELLGKQERFGQAEECYTQLCTALDREGRLPQKRTQETMAFLREMQSRGGSHQRMLASPSSMITRRRTSSDDEEASQGVSDAPVQEAEALHIFPETRHLIGREAWLRGVSQMVQAFPAKKLVILQGPIGVGKSSELTRLAQHFRQVERSSYRVVWLSFPTAEWSSGPEAALDVLLGTLLSECGIASFSAGAPRDRLLAAFLAHLKQQRRPTVIFLDNAECLLEENGELALCWEAFLREFVRSRHQSTFLLATKEWHGWSGRESIFVAETFVPPLSPDESTRLLQHLGLSAAPTELLQEVGVKVAGIPLMLEWTARLVADPLLVDDWTGFDESEAILQTSPTQESMIERLQRLLSDPYLLGEHLANRLAPLLQRIVEKHLSDEARLVLAQLAVATIPLGKPALQTLCPRPRLLKELRDASLLAAYTNRVQLLPVVAFMVQRQLSPAQRQEAEVLALQAYTHWLDEGNLEMREAGSVVTELASLLLTHHQLLDAAQLLTRCGWMSFKLGYGPRLALLAQKVMDCENWHQTAESECAGLVLIQIVFPFLGTSLETKKYVNYQWICDAFLQGTLILQAATEGYVVHLLLLDSINELRFMGAQAILDAYHLRLKARHIHPERHESWLQKQALLFGAWCEYLEEIGETKQARAMCEQTITLYQERAALFSTQQRKSPLKRSLSTRALASCFSYLGYHLYRIGRYEEALQVIEQAITLQEQGYANIGILASSYSDKSQILIGLGRLQEAIFFDEKAMAEIQQCADAGDVLSQEDRWTYVVNRGRLYVRLGRVEEAEQLLLDAFPRLHAGRRKYRMFAKEALDEIERWRCQTVSSQHQIDWRWVERYRELVSYDSYWWLTWAGPFTEEEQQEWIRLSALPLDEAIKMQLNVLMKQSRERELAAAMTEQREPRLHYPAIAIEDIRRRIAAHLQLRTEIDHDEPHAIVRRLYQGAIEEELNYLHLIEATHERNTEQFRESSLRLFALPTYEEMEYALTHIQRTLAQGLEKPETASISQHLQEFLLTHLHLSLPLEMEEEEHPEQRQKVPITQPQGARTISAHTAQRFFEAILKESGYEGWKVIIDANATGARVEQGSRCLFLPEKKISLTTVKRLFAHELAGHVARCMAGERSQLGLLGIRTKNVSCTEEGYVLYHERQIAGIQGQTWDDSGMRLSTLAIGLALGIMSPPQTFRTICSFIESFSLLRRLFKHPEKDREQHQRQARTYALDHCLRVFRGVPDLTQAGVCYPQDAIYLHGLFMVEKAVAQDTTTLDRLAVGKVALELLPDMQELGITTSALPSLYPRAYDPELDAYILSFEEVKRTSEEDS